MTETIQGVILIAQKVVFFLNLPILVGIPIILFLFGMPSDIRNYNGWDAAASLVFSFFVWSLYEISLLKKKNGDVSTWKLLSILFTFYCLVCYAFFLVNFMSINHKTISLPVFFTFFFGNIITLVLMGRSVKAIARLIISIEKRREVKLEEYAFLSFLLILQLFGIPLLHNRIKKVLTH